jgi:RNA polymerase sigma-70 factor (ECF subfamily)
MSSDEAEDVVQDLMIKFWQKKEELEQFGNLKSYALKSVRNECLNRLKHHDVKMGFADMQLHRSSFTVWKLITLKEHIIGFINQLPENRKW